MIYLLNAIIAGAIIMNFIILIKKPFIRCDGNNLQSILYINKAVLLCLSMGIHLIQNTVGIWGHKFV